MKIDFIKCTHDSYGGRLVEPFRYFGKIISDRFEQEGIMFSFEEIQIQLAFFSANLTDKHLYINWYNKLPTYHRNNNIVKVILPVLETEKSLEDVFKLACQAFKIMAHKKKEMDIFDEQKIVQTLLSLELELQNADLWDLNKQYKSTLRATALKRSLDERTARENRIIENKKLIYDLQFYYEFENADKLYFAPYDKSFCDKILIKLRKEKFRLPDYTHLHIIVSDSFENALYYAGREEKYCAYGITVFKDYAAYADKSETEKERITFDLIKQGLYDIAKIDKLDLETLEAVLDETEREIERKSFSWI
ncbi:hypothetical protein [Flavobacterium chilense]|uniref:Uncharacterized protein n=1 Tax=Flavobacterium chilense TaxID=946677 RepID=A0A1M7F1Z5_9FLAO|nr:hypothetical protein [Flavobacterium chilense]SHL97728.1 hypothetical protein SAMN05444484_103177 [Flavobacterium chilense]